MRYECFIKLDYLNCKYPNYSNNLAKLYKNISQNNKISPRAPSHPIYQSYTYTYIYVYTIKKEKISY